MANKKWIQKANRRMKRRGTVGAFTNYCGGRVTQACIDRAKNSDDPTLRRRAQFAENMRGIGTRKGREGIRKEREEMFLGGVLSKAKALGGSDKFSAFANAAGAAGGQGVGGQALSGLASGAAMGAALGPLGAVGGAIIGGVAGLFKGRKAKKEAEEAQAKAEADEKKRQAEMQKIAYQAQYDATVQNMPQENYENVNTGVAYQEGGPIEERSEAVQGKRRLPGGLELKLKNGAKKYVGNKHDEAGNGSDSGIILERSTKTKKGLEVEDGELEVKDDKGAYIVSNYLKNPKTGNTLAEDLEKELEGLDKEKDAEKIEKINKKYIDLNEELKDERKEPESVKAAHGIRRKFMQDGGRKIKTYEEFVAAYPKFTDHADAYDRYVRDMAAVSGGFEGTNVIQGDAEVEAWQETPEPGPAPLPMTEQEVTEVVKPGLQTDGMTKGLLSSLEKTEDNTMRDFLSNLEDVEVPLERAAQDEVEEAEKKGGKFKNFLSKAKDVLGNIPRGYGQGTMLQALGAAAYLKNQDDPMAPMLAPSYLNRIPPAEYKSFAPERAAASAAFNAQKNAIDTSIAGPAAIAARQAAAASQAANMSKIATQDVRERAQINQLNANNELRVALANQKAYNDTTRANATAKYAAELEKFKNKYAALDKIGDTSAQAIKDRRMAQSERLYAAATQIGGAFDRAEERYGFNKMFPFLGQDKTAQGGFTAEEAQALGLLNDNLAGGEEDATAVEDPNAGIIPVPQPGDETQDEEQERRGGRRKKKRRYIKRTGTVNRRRRIKKK